MVVGQTRDAEKAEPGIVKRTIRAGAMRLAEHRDEDRPGAPQWTWLYVH